MPDLSRIARRINKTLKSQSSMGIGKVLQHPDGRTVKIKSGYFLDPTYFSNQPRKPPRSLCIESLYSGQ